MREGKREREETDRERERERERERGRGALNKLIITHHNLMLMCELVPDHWSNDKVVSL